MKKRKIKWGRVALIVALPLAFTGKFTKVDKSTDCVPLNKTIEISIPQEESYYRSLGTFKVTYFCGGACCNSEKYAGIAANGEKLEIGMCAADKSIPFGTELYLNQDGMMECYTVTDRGSAITGNHIDIYCESHEMANKLGVLYTEVFVKE